MIMMMQGHTLDALVSSASLDVTTFPWIIWHHMRGFTAPIFLTVSGMLFALTLKRSEDGAVQKLVAWKRIRWALILAVVGYLLVFPANSIRHLPFVHEEGWRMFFQVNILHLNAVSLILITLLALATRSDRSLGKIMLSGAVVITLVTPFVNSVDWFALLPEGMAAYLSYAHGSIFPIFPFGAYMMFGAAAGVMLKTQAKEYRSEYLKRHAWKIGAVSLALGAGLAALLPLLSFVPQLDFLQSSPACVFLREGVVLVFISLVAVVYSILRRWEEYLALFGKQSLAIYVVHLILLFGTPWFPSIGRMYFKELSLMSGSLWAVAIVSGTLFLIYTENYLRHNAKPIAKAARFSMAAILAYALLV